MIYIGYNFAFNLNKIKEATQSAASLY